MKKCIVKKCIIVFICLLVCSVFPIACGKSEDVETGGDKEEVIEVEDVSYEYDGEAHGLKIKGLKEGDRVEYSKDGFDYSEEEIKYTEVGAYTVYYIIKRDDETIKSGNAKIYIGKRILDGITCENLEIEYDGEAHGIEIKGIKEGDRIQYSIDGKTYEEKEIKVSDVGKYTVYYIVERGHAEYRDSCEIEIVAKKSTLIVDGKALEITCREKKEIAIKNIICEYDGKEHGIAIETNGIVCVKKGDGYTKDIPKYSEVGRYECEYTVIEDGFLPIEVTGVVEIKESKNGIYFNDDAVIEIESEGAKRNGKEIPRADIEMTDVGVVFLGNEYKKLMDGKIIEIRINENSFVKKIEPQEYHLIQTADGIIIEDSAGEEFYTNNTVEGEITRVAMNGTELELFDTQPYYIIAKDMFYDLSYNVLEIGI